MQEAMFTGVFAALSTELRMNNIANNLANVNSNGFKRDQLAFKDTMIQFAHDQIREPIANIRSKPLFPEPQIAARVRIAVAQTDFTQGGLQSTGNSLDVAITGNGFFRIQTPTGEFYSRNGSFILDGDGQIVTKQGWPVQGEGGPVVVPDGTKDIYIAPDGRVFADDAQIGALALSSVEDPKQLEHLGQNLYRAREGAAVIEGNAFEGDNGARLQQGFLEASNVEVVTEMVNMIETQRFFEAMQKVMQTSDSFDRETISRIGRSR